MRLMKNVRESIKSGQFPEFVKEFMNIYFPNQSYPQWVIDSLKKVNIKLKEK